MAEQAMSTGSLFGPGDPTQERAIATRRAMEASRLQRIKDPKSRTMGIDTEALSSQVAEKKAQLAAEKTLQNAYDAQRLQQDAQLAYLEQERLRAERTKAQFVDQFRMTEQGKEKSREYDLNDPLSKFKDLPGRVGDEDGRLSVSGMQQFHGEDLHYAQRVKVQQEELRQWSAELSAAKASRHLAEQEAAAIYAERAMQVDAVKTDLEATARMARTQQAVAVAEYQLAQAAAKREREAAAQKAELQDNIEEIQNNLAGDVLTENPSVGRSFIAPNRVRPDHYKGMSPHEQQAILMAQEAQRAQKLAADAAAKAEDAAADSAMENTRRAGAYQDAQVAAMRADMRKKILDDNVKLAGTQYAAKSFLASNVYTNAIDASFFDQFGTTSR
jgi:hypothetical protein